MWILNSEVSISSIYVWAKYTLFDNINYKLLNHGRISFPNAL